ncbi:flagellar assembly protein FliW [Peribacillus asahii]|uniref:flagellar assembly protein FliW n=1 Tax=Peribacillus asahii TaxID=228899 RepID=UPI00207AC1C4|nr:flagellar assembly protein FliW [Peribacillus asahii]USK69975.1 flagellar assembly protein FliW [Peribacillus asahii]
MHISTKFHGEIEINEADIFTFQGGIPGFEAEKRFTLLPLNETPFCILQSISTPEVAFITTNPFDVFPTYEVNLSNDVLTDLQIQSEQDVTVFTILSVRDPFEQTTANLQAPIILNDKKKLGKQYIMKTDKYTPRHELFPSPVKQEVK